MPAWTRRRARAAALVLALACAVVAVVGASTPAVAWAKSYAMTEVKIDAVVAPDGSMAITEKRTFDFSGDYTFVFWVLDKGGSEGIDNITFRGPDGAQFTPTSDSAAIDTRPPGTYLLTDLGDSIEVRAFFRLSDTSAPFTIGYTVRGAAKRWSDTSELYWKFVGDQSEMPASNVSVRVQLPGVTAKDQVRAWGHGPLTGDVAIAEDGLVSFTVDRLPAQTFVEGEILFPTDALPQVAMSEQAREEQVLADEKQWAEEANAARTRAKAQVFAGAWLTTLFALGALALSVWLFLRYGREYKSSQTGYIREDPDPTMHPAVIGALWRFGTVNEADVAATLMQLANDGVITMRPVTDEVSGFLGFTKTEETFELTLNAEKAAGVSDIDAELIRLLFETIGANGRVTIEDIKQYAKKEYKPFYEAMNDWKGLVSAKAEMKGYFESSGKFGQIGLFVLAAAVAAVTIAGAGWSQLYWPPLVGIPCAVAIGILAAFMRRRSQAANELYRKYEGLRDFLQDFSRLNEAPPMHVILWERFLVLAVVFGIAQEVIEQMRVRIPEVVQDPGFQPMYWWVYSGNNTYGGSPVGALQSGFASAAQIAQSHMSSASGGGGGFSGGGGFGGGGGGVGAG